MGGVGCRGTMIKRDSQAFSSEFERFNVVGEVGYHIDPYLLNSILTG